MGLSKFSSLPSKDSVFLKAGMSGIEVSASFEVAVIRGNLFIALCYIK